MVSAVSHFQRSLVCQKRHRCHPKSVAGGCATSAVIYYDKVFYWNRRSCSHLLPLCHQMRRLLCQKAWLVQVRAAPGDLDLWQSKGHSPKRPSSAKDSMKDASKVTSQTESEYAPDDSPLVPLITFSEQRYMYTGRQVRAEQMQPGKKRSLQVKQGYVLFIGSSTWWTKQCGCIGEDKLSCFKKLQQQNTQEWRKIEKNYQNIQFNLGKGQATVKLQQGKANLYQLK